MHSCIREEKCDITKIPIFEIYGMGWYIRMCNQMVMSEIRE